MKVQRFFAADMREGMKQVREELGADAVILSSQRVAGGVEVVATCEYEQAPRNGGEPPEAQSRAPVNDGGAQQNSGRPHGPLRKALGEALTQKILAEAEMEHDRSGESGHRIFGEQEPIRLPEHLVSRLSRGQSGLSDETDEGELPATWATDESGTGTGAEVADIRAELRGMRQLMDQCFGSMAWDAMGVRDSGHAMLVERFVRMGFDGNMARRLAESGPLNGNDSLDWRNALARLSKSIPVAGDDLTDAGGTFALLGPAGSGKTTTIGKLATRYALRHGAGQVALVTMDSQRIAGQEQLRTYGRILNVPVRVVDAEHPLEQVLAGLAGRRLILIDTAGLNTASREFDAQLRSISGCRQVHSLLVLPTTSQSVVLRSVCRAHARLQPAGCILTRLDESGQLGGAIGVAMREELPIAYLSDGQQVPHDLRVARAYSLVSRSVALMQEGADADYAHELGQAARSKPMALQAG